MKKTKTRNCQAAAKQAACSATHPPFSMERKGDKKKKDGAKRMGGKERRNGRRSDKEKRRGHGKMRDRCKRGKRENEWNSALEVP